MFGEKLTIFKEAWPEVSLARLRVEALKKFFVINSYIRVG